jgi:Kef-type K+ transport system membrane component KefB
MTWSLALLLAVVAMETALATTLIVLNEYDARGPMTDRLLALVALNNMYVLLMFGVVTAGLTLAQASGDGWLSATYRAMHGLLWTTLGSIALGALLGLLMDFWAARAKESGEAVILSIGAVLIAVGASRWLGLSPLFAALALGATIVNASAHGDRLLCALGRADPPLYAPSSCSPAPSLSRRRSSVWARSASAIRSRERLARSPARAAACADRMCRQSCGSKSATA